MTEPTPTPGRCSLCGRAVDVGRPCTYFVCQGYTKHGIPTADADAAFALKADRSSRGEFTLATVGRWLGEWLVLAYGGGDRVGPIFKAARRVHPRRLDIVAERHAVRTVSREAWTADVVAVFDRHAELTVPGLLRWDQAGEAGRQMWAAAPWLEGASTLRDRFEGGPLAARDPALTGRVLDALLEAIMGLHEAKVVHGALTPSCIYASEHDIWVGGLGPFPDYLVRPSLLTTPENPAPYRAPELAEGRDPRVACDVYAVAAVALELMTGQATLGPAAKTLPAPLLRAFEAALDPDPRRRPSSVSALGEAVEAAVGATLAAAPRAAPSRTGLPAPVRAPVVHRPESSESTPQVGRRASESPGGAPHSHPEAHEAHRQSHSYVADRSALEDVVAAAETDVAPTPWWETDSGPLRPRPASARRGDVTRATPPVPATPVPVTPVAGGHSTGGLPRAFDSRSERVEPTARPTVDVAVPPIGPTPTRESPSAVPASTGVDRPVATGSTEYDDPRAVREDEWGAVEDSAPGEARRNVGVPAPVSRASAPVTPRTTPAPAAVGLAAASPAVVSPTVSPAVVSPAVVSPAVVSPALVSPALVSPAVVSPAVVSPALVSPAVVSPAVVSPVVAAPAEPAVASVAAPVEHTAIAAPAPAYVPVAPAPKPATPASTPTPAPVQLVEPQPTVRPRPRRDPNDSHRMDEDGTLPPAPPLRTAPQGTASFSRVAPRVSTAGKWKTASPSAANLDDDYPVEARGAPEVEPSARRRSNRPTWLVPVLTLAAGLSVGVLVRPKSDAAPDAQTSAATGAPTTVVVPLITEVVGTRITVTIGPMTKEAHVVGTVRIVAKDGQDKTFPVDKTVTAAVLVFEEELGFVVEKVVPTLTVE